MSELFDSILSNSVIGLPILFLISLALKSIYFNSNVGDIESNNENEVIDKEVIDKIVHNYHDSTEKTVSFCPHCDKKYNIPQEIGIKVKCPSCNKINYHNI